MLVLSRKSSQEIHVPEYGIKFRVLAVEGSRVRIGIDAPEDIRILRSELAFDASEAPSAKPDDEDCLSPGYVWPLGVRFVPGQAVKPSSRADQRTAENTIDSARFAPSFAH